MPQWGSRAAANTGDLLAPSVNTKSDGGRNGAWTQADCRVRSQQSPAHRGSLLEEGCSYRHGRSTPASTPHS